MTPSTRLKDALTRGAKVQFFALLVPLAIAAFFAFKTYKLTK